MLLYCEACTQVWTVVSMDSTTYSCPHCHTVLVEDNRDMVPYAGGVRSAHTFTKGTEMIPMRPLKEVMVLSIEDTTGVKPDADSFPEDYYAGSTELYGYDFARCPACGETMDWCQGHGEMGDPVGFNILRAHDLGDHSMCSELGCEELSNEE